MKYDLVIIGAGPAGLTAAIYAGRQNLKTALISADLGGQITKSSRVDNYPGLPKVSGQELISKMKEQVDDQDVDFHWKMIDSINKKDDRFQIKASDGKIFEAISVIIAYGKSPRKLNVPGEDKLVGKGVGYCAICDMPFFNNKKVAVVGGGNSAIHAVMAAEKVAGKIYLIHRREEFRAEKEALSKVKEISKTDKLEIITPAKITRIKGDKLVNAIEIKNTKTNKSKSINLDGVFVEIGFEVKNKLVRDLVDIDDRGEVVTNLKSESRTPGLFVAGDISAQAHDQAIIAAGQGAVAAISANQYIKGSGGEKL
jgi:thioredoxin reductase (NADPH)